MAAKKKSTTKRKARKKTPRKPPTPGRPSKWTPEAENTILAAARRCMSVAHCADLGGIAYATLNKWLKMDDVFALKFREARATAVMEAGGYLFEQMAEGSTPATKYFLTCHGGPEWRETTVVSSTTEEDEREARKGFLTFDDDDECEDDDDED